MTAREKIEMNCELCGHHSGVVTRRWGKSLVVAKCDMCTVEGYVQIGKFQWHEKAAKSRLAWGNIAFTMLISLLAAVYLLGYAVAGLIIGFISTPKQKP